MFGNVVYNHVSGYFLVTFYAVMIWILFGNVLRSHGSGAFGNVSRCESMNLKCYQNIPFGNVLHSDGPIFVMFTNVHKSGQSVMSRKSMPGPMPNPCRTRADA